MAWLGGNGSAPAHNAAPHLLLSLLLTLLLVCYVFLWPLCCLNRLAGSGLLEPLIGTYGPGYASGVPVESPGAPSIPVSVISESPPF